MTTPIERFGTCRVIEPLHTGPLADVHRAIDEATGRDVVVKALRPTIAPSSPYAAPLAREARILGRLHHQGIPLLYEVVKTESSMWLVLEHVDGFTLEQILAKAGRLSPHAALAIGIELAQALSHVHARGIVHRQLSPSNVLVSRRGEIKLIDFGAALDELAQASSKPFEPEGSFGTAAYMSPEQILGEPLDARADLFSFGILLYQLLAGARPFDGPDARTTAHRVRHEPAPPLRPSLPELSRAAERIVLRCLEKNPDERFASAAELSGALETALRAATAAPRSRLVTGELSRIRLLGDAELPPLPGAGTAMLREMRPRGSLFSTAIVHLALLALLLGGGAFIQHRAERASDATGARAHGPLELSPKAGGSLRVVAHPWAQVIVDGQHVETTPFARPIPLSPGIHYVTLKHPNAPDERRVVRIVPGETVLLDVRMGVGQ